MRRLIPSSCNFRRCNVFFGQAAQESRLEDEDRGDAE
jgi:hypothetical protein